MTMPLVISISVASISRLVAWARLQVEQVRWLTARRRGRIKPQGQ